MKTLKNHQIIYDNECPLCSAYTNAFIKNEMLEANGRVTYNEYCKTNTHNVDLKMAQKKIALINTETGETTYGLDSMLKIISNRFPFVATLFSIKIIYWLFTKLYYFISFNRKVIAPSKQSTTTCYPDFNLKYRILFLVFCWAITTWILHTLTALFHFKSYSSYTEAVLLIIQIPIQYVVIKIKTKEVFVNYLGHLLFLSFFGSLLLLPIIIINHFILLSLIANAIYFFAVVFVLIIMHFKRVKLLELNTALCYSWVVFRVIILFYLIITNYIQP